MGQAKKRKAAGLPPKSQLSTESKKTLQATIKFMKETVPTLLKAERYQVVAKGSALHAAFLLTEELRNGVSEEKASFMPEAHVYKGDELASLVFLGDMNTHDDLDKIIAALFTKFEATAVVLSQGVWVSDMAKKNGGRPSQQPDRVNAGLGTVFLAPDKVAASMALPVSAK